MTQIRHAVFDLNDVLDNWFPMLLDFTNNKFGTNCQLKDVRSHGFWKYFGITREQGLQTVHEFYRLAFGTVRPIPEAQAGIAELSEKYWLTLLTDNALENDFYIYEFIMRHYPARFGQIIITNKVAASGIRLSKSDFCEQIRPIVFVEDSAENAINCAEFCGKVFLLKYPRNEDFKDLPGNVIPVADWNELMKILSPLP